MSVTKFEGHNPKQELIDFLRQQMDPEWEVDLVFVSMQENSEEFLNFTPYFYHDLKHWSNDRTFSVKAKLERYGDDEYTIHSTEVNRFKDIFTQLQMQASIRPKDVLKFDERKLIKDEHGNCEYKHSPDKDEWGDTCYEHPERLATNRYLVERDSFGSEYANNCYVCEVKRKAYRKLVEICPQLWETCKCGNKQPQLRSYQDPDEGMNGRSYERCDACYDRFWKNWHEENAMNDDDYYE